MHHCASFDISYVYTWKIMCHDPASCWCKLIDICHALKHKHNYQYWAMFHIHVATTSGDIHVATTAGDIQQVIYIRWYTAGDIHVATTAGDILQVIYMWLLQQVIYIRWYTAGDIQVCRLIYSTVLQTDSSVYAVISPLKPLNQQDKHRNWYRDWS